MKRVNGYRDLDEYFKRILNRKTINLVILEDKKIIRPEHGGINSVFWFKYFGVNVLFKAYDSDYQIFSELVSEELARLLEIKYAQYDTAKFCDLKGTITYDFRKENYKRIALGDILDYYRDNNNLLKKENFHNTYGNYYLDSYKIKDQDYAITNLEDIWNAVEFYMYEEDLFDVNIIPELVEKVMIKLTDYFAFQIISGNYDMHSGNISVAIANDYSDVDLYPLYDNEDMFQLSGKFNYEHPNTPRLMLERGNLNNGASAMEMLKDYLSVSDSFFISRFIEKINKINYQTIFDLFDLVEEKIEIEIPKEIKENISNEFNKNLVCIRDVISEYQNKRGV